MSFSDRKVSNEFLNGQTPMVRIKLILVVTVMFALAMHPYPARAQQSIAFTFTPINLDIYHAAPTKAWSINARGEIVGQYRSSIVNGPDRQGFLRSADGYAVIVHVPIPNSGTIPRG